MKAYSWPGNVRELENFIELAINKEKLPLDLLMTEKQNALPERTEMVVSSLEEMEKIHISRVLEQEKHNMTNAARVLGIGRNTLYRKVEKYQIPIAPE